MKNTLISIIVPAYNIEKYIGRCIDSILRQSHTTLEVIVVDDGSTDGTGKVIDQYARFDQRIVVIHKENGGVSSARFAGLKKATGDYIGFVDGDDYTEPEMFSKLLKNAVKYNADISHCGYQMVFPNHIDYYYNTGRIVQQDRITGLKDLLSGVFIEPGLVNKLFHKTLFQSLLYEELVPIDIKINEDLLMNYWLFKVAESAIYEDFCPYHYILRKGSAATSKLNENKLKDPLRVMHIILKDSEAIPEVYCAAKERLIKQLVNIAVISVGEQKKLIKPFRDAARLELKNEIYSVLCNHRLSKSVKVKIMWVVIWPASYRWIHNIYIKITGLDKKYRVE